MSDGSNSEVEWTDVQVITASFGDRGNAAISTYSRARLRSTEAERLC